jgi:predicted GH43/DUF377 family glycosyl hydrolase
MMRLELNHIVGIQDTEHAPGGIFNPGAFHYEGDTFLICRREQYHDCRVFIPPVLVQPLLNRSARRIKMTLQGYHAGARLEDFRPIWHQDQLYVIHTQVHERRIKPVLGIFDPNTCILRRVDDLALPITLRPVEKNWVLCSDGDALSLIYSLDPYRVFHRGTHQWIQTRMDDPWQPSPVFQPRNSTNLIPLWGGYLGFWHCQWDQWYVQGAYFLDGDLNFVSRTGPLFDGQSVRKGYKPGVLYLSSVTDPGPKDDYLDLWFGVADTSVAHARVLKAEIKYYLEFHGPVEG